MKQTKPKREAPKTAFQPGQSGNPGGRPKIPAEVKELAKAHTEEAIRTLAEVMGDSSAPHSARVNAAEKLLDRAWGKSESTVNVNDSRTPRDLSTAELLSAIAALGVVGKEGGAGEPSQVH
jgi:hypothetical protein